MTNYKLVPVEPTDEMQETIWLAAQLQNPNIQYKAMIKDAPTVQEVDIDDELFHILEQLLKPIDFNDKQQVLLDAAMRTIAVLVVEKLKQKHGKLYAEVTE